MTTLTRTTHPATLTTPPPLGIAANLPPGGLIAIAWISVVLAGAFVAARTWIRITKLERLGWDDYWVYIAWIVLGVSAVLQTKQTEHLYYLVRADAGLVPDGQALMRHGNLYDRYEFVIIGLFWTVLWSIKASFLALYWKLFDGLRTYKRWWMGVAGFSFLAYAGCWISSAYNCHPPAMYFKFGKCQKPIDVRGGLISVSYTTTVDVLTDTMIIALPLNMLYKVRLAPKQKLGLATVFSLGIVIILVAIIRASQIAQKTFSNGVLLAVWGIIESTVSAAVIIGCLPPFKSLFQTRGSSSSKRSPPGSDHIPLRLYGGGIPLQSRENSSIVPARPSVMQRFSGGWSRDGVWGQGGRCGDKENIPKGCIKVQSEYEVSRCDKGTRSEA